MYTGIILLPYLTSISLFHNLNCLYYVSNHMPFQFVYSFEYRLRVALGPGGDLMLTSRVRNTSSDGKPFSFTVAHHTYFSVSDIRLVLETCLSHSSISQFNITVLVFYLWFNSSHFYQLAVFFLATLLRIAW